MAMTFMALSSGPLIAMLLQLMMIGWERLLRFFPPKWFVLVFFGAAVLAMIQLAYPGGLASFVIDTFAYNQQTGTGRTEILEYGGATVLRHPLFGIGLSSDWGQPWWRAPSIDNYWLVVAIRYGLPALAFMWTGIALHATQIAARRDLPEDAASYRKGYLIALAGLFVVLGTVHIWGAVSVFIMFYLGAGAWIYSAETPEPATRRGRMPSGRRGAVQREPPFRQARGAGQQRDRDRFERMIKTFRMLMDLLTPRERRGFYVLTAIMLLVALFETAGVASILPFMAVLAEPAKIHTNGHLSTLYTALHFTSANGFLVFLGIGTFLMTMLGIVMHILSLYTITRFTNDCSYMLSTQLLGGYLSQPYAWFLNRHSADLGKAVLSEVDNVVSQSFMPGMSFLSNLIVAGFISVFLIALQPIIARRHHRGAGGRATR